MVVFFAILIILQFFAYSIAQNIKLSLINLQSNTQYQTYNLTFNLLSDHIINYRYLTAELTIQSNQQEINPIFILTQNNLTNLYQYNYNSLIQNSQFFIDKVGYVSKSLNQFISINLENLQTPKYFWNLYFVNTNQSSSKYNYEISFSLKIFLSQQEQCIQNCNFTENQLNPTSNFCSNGQCSCSSDIYYGRFCQYKFQKIDANSFYKLRLQGWQWTSLALMTFSNQNKYRLIIQNLLLSKTYVQINYYKYGLYQEPNYMENLFIFLPQTQNNFIDLDNDQLNQYQTFCEKKQLQQTCKIIINILVLSIGIQNFEFNLKEEILVKNQLNDEQFLNILIIVIVIVGSLSLILLIFMFLTRCIKNRERLSTINREHQANPQNNQYQIQKNINKCLSHELIEQHMPAKLYETFQKELNIQEQTECVICLCNLEKQEMCRLTVCLHLFHKECLDMWFAKNSICPYCRQENSKKAWQELILNTEEKTNVIVIKKNKNYVSNTRESCQSIPDKEMIQQGSSNQLFQNKLRQNTMVDKTQNKSQMDLQNLQKFDNNFDINNNICNKLPQQVSITLFDDEIEENQNENQHPLRRSDIQNTSTIKLSFKQQRSQRSITICSDRYIQQHSHILDSQRCLVDSQKTKNYKKNQSQKHSSQVSLSSLQYLRTPRNQHIVIDQNEQK